MVMATSGISPAPSFGRRAADKDELAAKEAGWKAYLQFLDAAISQALPLGRRDRRELYMRSLDVYRRELATIALRRQVMGR